MAADAGESERDGPQLSDAAPGERATIYAVSSGAAPAAIAVVRISGPAAAGTLVALVGSLPAPRRATLRLIATADGEPLDRAIILWMPGPETVTGEDVAELHLHGGRATVAATLATLARLPGLRPAEAGEFTRRALANGRIDLAQAEGLADLLAAETERQRRAALRATEGGLGRLVAGWRERTLALSAMIEAAIEFAEEHDVDGSAMDVDGAAALRGEIEQVLAAPPAERLRDGVRVIVAGPVNAGKSTLVNALVGRDVAIATPIAGTTRDIIEVPVQLAGVPYLIIDSAGLRETSDPVERIGVARAEAAVDSADIILWLGECDAAPHGAVVQVDAMSDRGDWRPGSGIAVSAKTGAGMQALVDRLQELASNLLPSHDAEVLAKRQRVLLTRAAECINAAATTSDEIIAAEEMRAARACFDQVTGAAGTEEMLDALFARFCVGK